MTYPELHAHSAFSFLDGASQPEELAVTAAALGYDAVALTDHDGLCGSLAFAHAAREVGVRPITGCEITLEGGAHLTLLAKDDAGYRSLSTLVTAARAGRKKGEAETTFAALDTLGPVAVEERRVVDETIQFRLPAEVR